MYLPGGRTIVAFGAGGDFTLWGLDAKGERDRAFGEQGSVQTNFLATFANTVLDCSRFSTTDVCGLGKQLVLHGHRL